MQCPWGAERQQPAGEEAAVVEVAEKQAGPYGCEGPCSRQMGPRPTATTPHPNGRRDRPFGRRGRFP
eukprot:3142985-Heterocapsa_arctica.AAC.1